jgi:hypothetical protein
LRQCHEWTTQVYTFGIHVQHEKGRGAQGKGRKGRGAQGMAKKGRGAQNFGGGVQRPSILV